MVSLKSERLADAVKLVHLATVWAAVSLRTCNNAEPRASHQRGCAFTFDTSGLGDVMDRMRRHAALIL
jgi:hypothetical protein